MAPNTATGPSQRSSKPLAASSGSNSNSSSGGGAGPISVKNSWAYAVRPPAWPIGTTPRVRGGVRLGSIATDVHIVFYHAPNIDRVFFLGGFDGAGAEAPCTVTAELISPGDPKPPSFDLARGFFAELVVDPLSPLPPKLVQRQFDTLPPTDPISLFLASIQPGGSGSTGGNGGSGPVGGA